MANFTATFTGSCTTGWFKDGDKSRSPIYIYGCTVDNITRSDGVVMPDETVVPSQAVITGFRITFESAQESDHVEGVQYSMCGATGSRLSSAWFDPSYGLAYGDNFYLTKNSPNNASARNAIIGKSNVSFYIAPYTDDESPENPDMFYVGSPVVTLTITYVNDYASSTGRLSRDAVPIDGSSPVYLTVNNNCTSGYYDKVTHKIVWSIPAYGYSYTQNVDAVNAKSFNTASYIVPTSLIASNMADTGSAVMNVQLQTYQGSTLLLPAQDFTLTVVVPDTVRPTFGAGGANGLSITRFHDAKLDALLASKGVLESDIGCVQNHDGASILASGATGVEGSTITDYVFTVSGKSYTQHVGDASFGAAVTPEEYAIAVNNGTAANASYVNVYRIPLVTVAYNTVISCYVIDSRGHRSATQSITLPVTSYSVPSITEASSIRCDEEGTALETGLYARASATATYSRLTVVLRDSNGDIVYTENEDSDGNPIPQYQNLNTLEITVAYGYPTYDESYVDEYGDAIPIWHWYSPEDDVIGTPLSPTTGSKVVGDGTANHVTAIRFLANDYFTSTEEEAYQPTEIVFTTSSEYVIFFREGGTGVSFGQALGANEDNRFVVSDAWAMLHGDNYIPSIVVSTSQPSGIPSTAQQVLWLKPTSTGSGTWTTCQVYYYNP